LKLDHPAERLLKSYGITEPCEIDLDAIAFDLGVKIRIRKLKGCEAKIIGLNDRAIISLNQNGSQERRRFSLAHELGHWHYHRGQRLDCRVNDYQPNQKKYAERLADEYAASLLMPRYLFNPLACQFQKPTIKTIESLQGVFHSSFTATAIRLADANLWPLIIICHGLHGRKWFHRSPCVPKRWFPRDELDVESSAIDILFGDKASDSYAKRIGADAWFDRREAGAFEILEQTTMIGNAKALSILTITDERMLED
tara:strand:- start:226 stop:990 length:765 start_codon:yes stop_codon:yes gene_type:complete